MKERIVLEKHEMYKLLDCLPMPMITDEDLEKEIKEGRKLILFGKERKTEQVPETYEELKELVRQNIFEDFANGVKIGKFIKVEYILIDGKSFMPDGEILDEDNDVFAVNRTPEQMWEIIKGLIGGK